MDKEQNEAFNKKMFFDTIQNEATVPLPKITEEIQNDWVKWGSNNLFPSVLVDAINSSPTHNSIMLLKRQLTEGKRVIVAPDDGKKGLLNKFLTRGSDKKTEEFIAICNDDGESLHDVIGKIAFDQWVFGQSYFQPVYKKDGRLQIYHIPTEYVRSGIAVEGRVKNYWFTQSWKDYRKEQYKPTNIQLFDPLGNKKSQSIIPIKSYRPGTFYYPLPEYYPCMNWILIDGDIARHHRSNLQYGLVSSMLIQFNNGVPPEEMRHEIRDKIEEQLAGSRNSGKMMLLFNDNKDNEATIETLDTPDIDKMYVTLNEMVLQNILTASRLTSPLLIGIKTEGQLGVVDEMKSSYELFYNSVILPTQKKIMKEINKVGLVSGLKPMVIETPSPLDFMFSESILGKVLTINELRKEIGYDEHPDGDKLIEYTKETDNMENPTVKKETKKDE